MDTSCKTAKVASHLGLTNMAACVKSFGMDMEETHEVMDWSRAEVAEC